MLYGINDRQTIIDSQPRIDFRLYKGSKKQKGKFGQDLKDKFRLETSDDYLTKSRKSRPLFC